MRVRRCVILAILLSCALLFTGCTDLERYAAYVGVKTTAAPTTETPPPPQEAPADLQKQIIRNAFESLDLAALLASIDTLPTPSDRSLDFSGTLSLSNANQETQSVDLMALNDVLYLKSEDGVIDSVWEAFLFLKDQPITCFYREVGNAWSGEILDLPPAIGMEGEGDAADVPDVLPIIPVPTEDMLTERDGIYYLDYRYFTMLCMENLSLLTGDPYEPSAAEKLQLQMMLSRSLEQMGIELALALDTRSERLTFLMLTVNPKGEIKPFESAMLALSLGENGTELIQMKAELEMLPIGSYHPKQQLRIDRLINEQTKEFVGWSFAMKTVNEEWQSGSEEGVYTFSYRATTLSGNIIKKGLDIKEIYLRVESNVEHKISVDYNTLEGVTTVLDPSQDSVFCFADIVLRFSDAEHARLGGSISLCHHQGGTPLEQYVLYNGEIVWNSAPDFPAVDEDLLALKEALLNEYNQNEV